ncbi:hypothetical protein NQ318_011270 [Aromia moschata]|uniref:Uncharacterized protein n=1 Tax=Aromia moschata TaxID=1265417 RepID=A0AAV8YHQ8_9CUCU|nr:hypothetical protein NQ318_011270 [Aromia moschata]
MGFLIISRRGTSEFLPEGQTINKEYYLAILRRLREGIRRKRQEFIEPFESSRQCLESSTISDERWGTGYIKCVLMSDLATTASTINHDLVDYPNWISSACVRLSKQTRTEPHEG